MKHRSSLASCIAAFIGCADGIAPCAWEPAIEDMPPWRAELVYAARDGEGLLHVGGFDGAAPPNTDVSIRDANGAEIVHVETDASGRFHERFGSEVTETRVELVLAGAEPLRIRVRAHAASACDAVTTPIDGAGDVPNDLVIAGDRASPRAVLVRSGDNAVGTFDLARGLDDDTVGVRLPEVEGPTGPIQANPWFAAFLDDDAHRVAVTAFGQRHVYIVDLDGARVERTLVMDRVISLATPFVLSRPLDIDDDGIADTELESFIPRAPQAVARIGKRLVAGFSGFVAGRQGSDKPPVYLPAVLAAWDLDDLDRAPALLVLPRMNPQELRRIDDARVLVACSGVLDHVGGGVSASTRGGVYIVDVEQNSVTSAHEFDDFAAGTAAIVRETLFVGSLLRPIVRKIDPRDPARFVDIELNDEGVDSIFRMIELPGGLIALPSFNTDRVHVLDAADGALNPAPFFRPFSVGPGRPVFDGPQIIARRPGRAGVDFVGPDLFVLAGAASRVTPIETRKVLGP